MDKLEKRRAIHKEISNHLKQISDDNLERTIKSRSPIHNGIGGHSALIYIKETPVFLKEIPLTDLELQPSNILSTANIFELPLHYQYGIGSVGFGAWRELAAQQAGSQAALDGECPFFPVMYHWRIKNNMPSPASKEKWNDVEKHCEYWEDTGEITQRIEAIHRSSSTLQLFIEYIPHNLYTWLESEIAQDSQHAENAIAAVEAQLAHVCNYMQKKGMVHFDLHFFNILSDGKQIYISDFGLALSAQFSLSKEELIFLKSHHDYDKACSAISLIHCIISCKYKTHGWFGIDNWLAHLHDSRQKRDNFFSNHTNHLIDKYAPIAIKMDSFFATIRKSKKINYPAYINH